MARYSRKYVEISAVKNDGNWKALMDFLSSLARSGQYTPVGKPAISQNEDGSLNIRDNDGYTAPVPVGWYLIFDGKRFAPCRPEFFEAAYDLIEEPTSLPEPPEPDSLHEQLAAIEHQRWADWQQYLHSLCERREDGALIIPADRVKHWERQIDTPYAKLSEAEKAMDREQVDRYWNIAKPQTQEVASERNR